MLCAIANAKCYGGGMKIAPQAEIQDGLLDLVMLDHEGYISFFKRTADKKLLPPQRVLCDEAGNPIQFNAGVAGKSGRRKLTITDWNGDGALDILINSSNAEWWQQTAHRDGKWLFKNSGNLSDINLAFLDSSDVIVEIVTYDSTTIHNTIAMADTFRSIGYPPTKVRYLVNRADSPGGIDPDDLQRALGRVPEHRVMSDGQLVVRSNNEGVPFILANPTAPITQDLMRVATELIGSARIPVAAGRR